MDSIQYNNISQLLLFEVNTIFVASREELIIIQCF